MSEEKSTSRSTLTVFAVGALIGAGIALLYAPQSGKDTRKMLVKKGKMLRNKAQDTVETAQEYIKDRKADLVAVFDHGKEALHDTKHKRA